MSQPIHIWYHANCYDGFGAAFAAWLGLREQALAATFTAVSHQEEPPDVPDDVLLYILDFSYPREVMVELSERCTLTCLDHHKTAEAELAGLPGCYFDMDQSGAVLAWNWFVEAEPAPTLLRYIQDRDLWQWKLPHSKAINLYLRAVLSLEATEANFEVWHRVMQAMDISIEEGREVGSLLLRQVEQLVKYQSKAARVEKWGEHTVVVCNATAHPSELGNYLCTEHPEADFSATYHDEASGRCRWSLRSVGEFDVSVVAKRFGGGGHRNAAGFKTSQMYTNPFESSADAGRLVR